MPRSYSDLIKGALLPTPTSEREAPEYDDSGKPDTKHPGFEPCGFGVSANHAIPAIPSTVEMISFQSLNPIHTPRLIRDAALVNEQPGLRRASTHIRHDSRLLSNYQYSIPTALINSASLLLNEWGSHIALPGETLTPQIGHGFDMDHGPVGHRPHSDGTPRKYRD